MTDIKEVTFKVAKGGFKRFCEDRKPTHAYYVFIKTIRYSQNGENEKREISEVCKFLEPQGLMNIKGEVQHKPHSRFSDIILTFVVDTVLPKLTVSNYRKEIQGFDASLMIKLIRRRKVNGSIVFYEGFINFIGQIKGLIEMTMETSKERTFNGIISDNDKIPEGNKIINDFIFEGKDHAGIKIGFIDMQTGEYIEIKKPD